MAFSDKILEWYNKNKRDLPWRASTDPYKIWLSEIILQQTRVAQGTPYYLNFIETFPKVSDLASAKQETVLKLWQGLGYYSRARNLHAAAKMVVDDYGGRFPDTYKKLITLKGVGDYTASAISSICFNERQAVVDGNVYRVLSRYFGVEIPINSTAGIKYFKELALEVLHESNVRDYNQGIMEFGAIQCTPKNPNCGQCPLKESCVALKERKTDVLPVKLKKTKVKTRYFNYLVPLFVSGNGLNSTLLKQRTGKGIWQDLWEFPLLESESDIDLKTVKENYNRVLGIKEEAMVTLFNTEVVVHKLSHQHLYTKFWILEIDAPMPDAVPISELHKYPVPVLISSFMNAFKF
ncbi:A/G-specific adenine glycosylase [Maribacter chungangensis]|uniref:Adenine DNA glycosylase n=1 Tax=Maribacter chungangensis TaxID=1069117 RepID=A0ABW3B9J4_9FLAO